MIVQDIFQQSERTKSEVWAYFRFYKCAERKLIKDGYHVRRKCRKTVSINGGTTLNLSKLPLIFSSMLDVDFVVAEIAMACLFNLPIAGQ